jgi:protein TonB
MTPERIDDPRDQAAQPSAAANPAGASRLQSKHPVRRVAELGSLDLMPHVAILCAMLVALVSAFAPTSVLADERKCLAIYAPRPAYPALPSGQRPEGKGLLICHIDAKTGRVTSVSIAKSTGFAILDEAAVDCYKRWRFKPGTCAREVKIPFEFTTHGLPRV